MKGGRKGGSEWGKGWVGGAPFVPSEFGDGVKLGSSDNRTPPPPPANVGSVELNLVYRPHQGASDRLWSRGAAEGLCWWWVTAGGLVREGRFGSPNLASTY